MGCCNSTELQNDSITIEEQKKSIKDVEDVTIDPQSILPPSDAAEFSEQRERFMTNITVVDNNEVEDAVIVPRKGSMSSIRSERERSMSAASRGTPSSAKQETPIPEIQRNRIATNADVHALDNWWGIGPDTPDRRLTASMPGHVAVSEIEDVMVRKASGIQQLRDELNLDDMCRTGEKYVLWQMKLGKVCLLSIHRVVNSDMYHKVLNANGGDLLRDSLKLIVMPVNLSVNVPVKGPKDADTIGAFFGAKNTHFSRATNGDCKYDISMISIDLYSVWSLKMLLPSVAFKVGRMVDFHLVSYRDNAVLASYRAAMTPEAIQLIKQLGL